MVGRILNPGEHEVLRFIQLNIYIYILRGGCIFSNNDINQIDTFIITLKELRNRAL